MWSTPREARHIHITQPSWPIALLITILEAGLPNLCYHGQYHSWPRGMRRSFLTTFEFP